MGDRTKSPAETGTIDRNDSGDIDEMGSEALAGADDLDVDEDDDLEDEEDEATR